MLIYIKKYPVYNAFVLRDYVIPIVIVGKQYLIFLSKGT